MSVVDGDGGIIPELAIEGGMQGGRGMDVPVRMREREDSSVGVGGVVEESESDVDAEEGGVVVVVVVMSFPLIPPFQVS